MRIPVLTELFRRRARARLRRVMRGYRYLRETGSLRRIAKVKEALTATPVFTLQRDLKIFAGLDSVGAELAVRQFLLARLVGTGLGPALLGSVGSRDRGVAYPLPRTWRKTLMAHGFAVDEYMSIILWAGFVAVYFANGAYVMLKLAMADLRSIFTEPRGESNRHVYFDTLGLGNLPLAGEGGEKYDIVSWYLRWPRRALEIDTICHNVMAAGVLQSDGMTLVPVSSPLSPLADFRSFVRFLGGGCISTSKALWYLIVGRWWYPMMLGESIKAFHVRVQVPDRLARDYLFHISNWIYRPLWTYEAERAGSRILFYFYATNVEQFKQQGIYPGPPYGWRAMTWPKYLVWDDYQVAFVRRAVGMDASIDVVGPITFHSAAPAPLDLNPLSIAVFDVQALRDAVYQPLGLDIEYYVPRNANRFLLDIQDTAAGANRNIVLKRKRDVGRRIHPAYERTILRLKKFPNCVEVDPDISASSLIERCQAVISSPFTSTALLGREQGKPSVYYDPHGICEKDDRAAHGIPILMGKAELQEWLSALS